MRFKALSLLAVPFCLLLTSSAQAQYSTSYQFIDVRNTNPGGDAAADFNADGKADLVTTVDISIPAGPRTQLAIAFSKGDGSFTKKPISNATPINRGENYHSQIADVNGDGIPDIIAFDTGFYYCTDQVGDCFWSSGFVSVLIGNGDGTFKDPQIYNSTSGVPTPFNVLVADLNGDGKLDLLVNTGPEPAAGPTTLQVLLNNGDGTFHQGKSSPTPSGSFGQAADLENNGKADLIIEGASTLHIYKNLGDGTFTPGASYSLGPPKSQNNYDAAVGDFNHDGRLDLIVSTGSKFVVLLGNGDGTFHTAGQDQTHPLAYVNPADTNVIPVAVGDFNKDGNLDFTAGPYVYFGAGDGSFTLSKIYSFGGAAPLVADFNGDGNLDLMRGAISFGNKNGIFNAPLVTTVSGPIAIGDFNRDGIPDVALDNTVLLGSGKGYFLPGKTIPLPSGGRGFVVAGDLNGDHILDLVFAGRYADGLLGKADGSFGEGTLSAPLVGPAGSSGTDVFLVDVNHAASSTWSANGVPPSATEMAPSKSQLPCRLR